MSCLVSGTAFSSVISIKSSPSITTKGSFPTKALACKTASPRPRGCVWRIKCRRMPVVSSTSFKRSVFPFSLRLYSNSKFESKWSSIERFDLPVTTKMSSIPDLRASSTINWIVGLSTIGNISLAKALVAGRKRVPNPAAGMTAFLTFCFMMFLSIRVYDHSFSALNSLLMMSVIASLILTPS